ncbi:hypothetical protein QN277_019770 [Acacia crassicarpa]|uniref:Uncharacterized protein n=1 Tax=Acacia crassicarpa TaxID=499986 RepID=A0AAE1MKD0_9FABA|nr:hypothetical protein QN277_019770 [Acacia crassicarpa]
MNLNYDKPNNQKSAPSASLKNIKFDFDLRIRSNQPKSLNDQKNPKSSHPYSSSSSSYSSASPNPRGNPTSHHGLPSLHQI